MEYWNIGKDLCNFHFSPENFRDSIIPSIKEINLKDNFYKLQYIKS